MDTVITRGVIGGTRDTILKAYDRLNRLTADTIRSVKYSARNGIMQQTVPPSSVNGGFSIDSTTYQTHSYPMFPNDASGNPNGYTAFADTLRFVYDKLGNVIRADNHDALVRRGYYVNGLIRADTLKIRTLAELSAGGDTVGALAADRHRQLRRPLRALARTFKKKPAPTIGTRPSASVSSPRWGKPRRAPDSRLPPRTGSWISTASSST